MECHKKKSACSGNMSLFTICVFYKAYLLRFMRYAYLFDLFLMNSRHKVKSSLVPFKIFFKYLDLLKDILLTNHVIEKMGGIGVVIQNPNIFSSVVSWFLACMKLFLIILNVFLIFLYYHSMISLYI